MSFVWHSWTFALSLWFFSSLKHIHYSGTFRPKSSDWKLFSLSQKSILHTDVFVFSLNGDAWFFLFVFVDFLSHTCVVILFLENNGFPFKMKRQYHLFEKLLQYLYLRMLDEKA